MQDYHQVKQVHFIDKVEESKKKLIIGVNSKSRICNTDGQSLYSFTSRTWIRDCGSSCISINDSSGFCCVEPINKLIEAANVSMMERIKGKKDFIIVLQAKQNKHVLTDISTIKWWRF